MIPSPQQIIVAHKVAIILMNILIILLECKHDVVDKLHYLKKDVDNKDNTVTLF